MFIRIPVYKDCDTVAFIPFIPGCNIQFTKSINVLKQLGSIKTAFQKNEMTNATFA
jgi:hypothetical protein